MDKHDIEHLYNKVGKVNTAIIRRDKFKQSQLYFDILNVTSFLPSNCSISERLECIVNNITSFPLCVSCNIAKKVFLPQGYYSNTCSSRTCIQQVPLTREKRNNTLIKKYGAKVSPLTRQRTKERINQLQVKGRASVLERYGVNNVSLLPDVKNKKKTTTLKNYGVEYPSQSSIIRERTIQNNIEKYGVSFPQQTAAFKERIKYNNQQTFNVDSHLQKHNPQAFANLKDYQWLYHHYIVLMKPAYAIANELGLHYKNNNSSTVCRYLHSHGLVVRRISAFSHKAIQWLEDVMKNENIFIQHAQNIGEYNIPNSKFSVDGYCKETNTVYEFHGDLFHGNPLIFTDGEHCHPFDVEITASELYQKTLLREEFIKNQGFNLIVKWETA